MRLTVALGFLVFVGCSSNVKGIDDLGSGGNGDDMGLSVCGDGVVDPGSEDCDDGAANGTPNDPCNGLCRFVCSVDKDCDDGNACNGTETCSEHLCVAGTPVADGTDCGSGKLCRAGTCGDARCGDGVTTAPEECDDGNAVDGDGCNSDCTFSCLSTDTSRNCTPMDACMGQGTCDDATHTCTAGTPLGDGMACGTGHDYCKMGTCTMPTCGNSVTEPGEDCDDGGLNGTKGDGCTSMCKFACVTASTDCGAAPDCEKFQCTAGHVCEAVADSTLNGMTCGASGAGLVCKDGACAAPTATCGNGIVETGEDCDFGAQNGSNTGCEAVTCKFSCANAAACDDGNACNGAETCDAVTATNGGTGKKCNAGTAEGDGTACGTTKVCVNKVCQNSTCGDGVVDTRTENCDPPGSMSGGKTCDSKCHYIVCGDGILEDTEQCDDSNTTNLDGCDGVCKFEQSQRANSLTMSFKTNVCTKNALGQAIQDPSNTAQNALQTALTNGVGDGTITIEMKFMNLDDLTGTKSTAAFQLGFMHATPVTGTGYNGASDLDWWYTTDVNSIDGNRNPTTALMNGKFNASSLTTDPGTIQLGLVLAGSVATLTMKNTVLTAKSTTATTPTASSGTTTPGHLASEHLLSTLKSFPSLSGGKICGDITAKSLAAVTLPMAFDGQCNEGYTSTGNTLLDVLVGGCTHTASVFGIPVTVTVIGVTQPDGPSAGAVHLTMTGTKVTGCTGTGGAYPACLDVGTYSSAFSFTTDRVIAK